MYGRGFYTAAHASFSIKQPYWTTSRQDSGVFRLFLVAALTGNMSDIVPMGTTSRPEADSYRALDHHSGQGIPPSNYHKKVYVFPSTTANSQVYFPYIIDVVHDGHVIRPAYKP